MAWIGIGAIAGLLVKGYGFGLIGNVVIGILGAGIAGLLAPRVGIHTESAAASWRRWSVPSSCCCWSGCGVRGPLRCTERNAQMGGGWAKVLRETEMVFAHAPPSLALPFLEGMWPSRPDLEVLYAGRGHIRGMRCEPR